MTQTLLYLSGDDVRALAINPGEAREAVLQTFRAHAEGLTQCPPKNTLMLGQGHGFQAMPATFAARGIAMLKWVAMAPVPPNSTSAGINSQILVNDCRSGVPLAILDGDEITLIRTAALSAAAASRLAPRAPTTIAFVGCGMQARTHLDAFLDLFPGLNTVLALSRSRSSAESFAHFAEEKSLATEVLDDPDELLSRCDIVISMVPGAPGLQPFLDARKLKPKAFACAVDIGRSWIPEGLTAFDVLATDSLAQSHAPYDVNSNPVTTASFGYDLVGLAAGRHPTAPEKRSLFCFRGFALADLALAIVVLERARELSVGKKLPR